MAAEPIREVRGLSLNDGLGSRQNSGFRVLCTTQEGGARLGNYPMYYYLTRFLTTHPKKGGSFELRFQLKLIGLGWNQLNLWL